MTDEELKELLALWEERGADAFRIIREADPSAFVRLVLYAANELEDGAD